jgi:hypothetical protein
LGSIVARGGKFVTTEAAVASAQRDKDSDSSNRDDCLVQASGICDMANHCRGSRLVKWRNEEKSHHQYNIICRRNRTDDYLHQHQRQICPGNGTNTEAAKHFFVTVWSLSLVSLHGC